MSRIAPGSDRIATLDLLRLAAALSVVAFHYLFRGAAGEPLMDTAFPEAAPAAMHLYLGVNLFFVVSGFVIAWSAEGRGPGEFALARFLRIYPGFVLCMTATFVVLAWAGDPRLPASPGQWLANLLVLAPAVGRPFMDGVYWSIVLEIVFYGWVAIAIGLGVFERWKLGLVAGWLGICALNEFALQSGALRLLLVTEYGPWFAAGVLIHHVRSRGRSAEALALLAAALALSSAMLPLTQGWMQAHYGVAVPLGRLVVLNVALHALVVAALAAGHRVPASPLVLALGGLTYPLYLLHQNAGYVAIDLLAPHAGRWGALAAVTAAMLLASWAIWRFAEMPLRRPLRDVMTRSARRIGAAAAPLSLRLARRALLPVPPPGMQPGQFGVPILDPPPGRAR